MAKITPKSFLMPKMERKIDSWPQHGLHHITLTVQSYFKVFSHFSPQHSCSGIGLPWSPCKVQRSIRLFKIAQWFLSRHTILPRVIGGHQESPIMGPWTELPWVRNSLQIWDCNTAQTDQLTWVCNSSQTWECDTAWLNSCTTVQNSPQAWEHDPAQPA